MNRYHTQKVCLHPVSQKPLDLLTGYQEDRERRLAFNQLAMKVFGHWFEMHNLSFETWYQAGYWNEKYIPYTLFEKGIAIANVSVNILDFNVLGNTVSTIQIGTVMTHPDYRHQQLNRLLMEQVLADWEKKVSLIYLYANPTVLDLYPKFGFTPAKEYAWYGTVNHGLKLNSGVEKLNMENRDHQALLCQSIRESVPFSKVVMYDNPDLVMFSALTMLKNDIWYLPAEHCMAIATRDEDTLHLLDVYGRQPVALERIVATLALPGTKMVHFGFTPLDCEKYQSSPVVAEDTLFIRGEPLPLTDERWMFPLLSHA